MNEIKVIKKADIKEKGLPTRSELQAELNDVKRRFNGFLQAWQQKVDKWPVDPSKIEI